MQARQTINPFLNKTVLNRKFFMKKIILSVALLAITSSVFAQKMMTRTGKVTFFSSTPVENIEAINNDAAAVVDGATGVVKFIVPIKSFKFEKQLMQEHFNENYMESDKFPKAEFNGKISNLSAVNLSKDGSYPAKASGKMTIHGVTKDVVIDGTITVKGGAATMNSKFSVKTSDYGIKIPSVVASKIAEKIEVTVNAELAKK